MFRFSFLTFLLVYFFSSIFRTSLVDMLVHDALHSITSLAQHSESRYYDDHKDRPEHMLMRGCADGEVCHPNIARRRPQHTDDFGENGPLDRRYADPT
ncbi:MULTISPECIES: hypothetical protein [Pandoraea]|uniref:Uncharacterized protein n=2 Tax=Pandoraea TaxID=93217 RepID=A0A5E4XE15_9BURK|nr:MULTISPECIES: hypothetical protein [Pandoraea]VVE16717.1 hypothetical protein PCE31107_02933 [Pandoraea cepalis]VVE34537.1 hypothetical protein PTE31013_03854 [Pandoraea terrigena]